MLPRSFNRRLFHESCVLEPRLGNARAQPPCAPAASRAEPRARGALGLEREARQARVALRRVVDCAEGDVIKRDRCVETPRTSNRKPAARVPPACELSGVDEKAPLAFIDQPLADLDLPARRAFVLWARARVEQPAQLRIGAPCVGRAAAAVSGRVGLLELACLLSILPLTAAKNRCGAVALAALAPELAPLACRRSVYYLRLHATRGTRLWVLRLQVLRLQAAF